MLSGTQQIILAMALALTAIGLYSFQYKYDQIIKISDQSVNDNYNLQNQMDKSLQISYQASYSGDKDSDAFSSVLYLGNGICLAGKRQIYRPKNQIDNYIYRSTDYCKTFTDVGPINGMSGDHAYHFGQNDNRICFGTGDTGNPVIACSSDYGLNWKVVMTSQQINALYNTTQIRSVYGIVCANNGVWYAGLGEDDSSQGTSLKIMKSLNNGDTWQQHTALINLESQSNAIRKLYKKPNGDIIACCYFPNALFRSTDNGVTWNNLADNTKIPRLGPVFSFEDLGDGVFLMGDAATPSPRIYRSSDYGKTWSVVYQNIIATSQKYFRHIIKVKSDLVIAYISCDENPPWKLRGAQQLLSKDGGLTWVNYGNPYQDSYGGMHAIYDASIIEEGVFFIGAQPDSNILLVDTNN